MFAVRVALGLALCVAVLAAPDNITSTTEAPVTTTDTSNQTTVIVTSTAVPPTTTEGDDVSILPNGLLDVARRCKDACVPKVDVKASVIEAYKRHRAQVSSLTSLLLLLDRGSSLPISSLRYHMAVGDTVMAWHMSHSTSYNTTEYEHPLCALMIT